MYPLEPFAFFFGILLPTVLCSTFLFYIIQVAYGCEKTWLHKRPITCELDWGALAVRLTLAGELLSDDSDLLCSYPLPCTLHRLVLFVCIGAWDPWVHKGVMEVRGGA